MSPRRWQLFVEFLRLGAVAFGGPAMVVHIRRLAVERRGWLSEAEFREGVALCQAIPGATAMQCAAFTGLRTRGLTGALCAFAGFVLPAFLLMLVLSLGYGQALALPAGLALLAGLRWVVVALVAHAAWMLGRSHLKSVPDALLAAGAALLFFFNLHPLLILLLAVLAGWLRSRYDDPTAPVPPGPARRAPWRSPLLLGATGLLLIGLLTWTRPLLAQLFVSMVKVDLVAFGGGYAALPLLYREVVELQGWLPARTFLDGITLGQVTPGPIVITATFIGHQVAGWAGALTTTAGIFLPSLFMLTLAEPWFQRLNRRPDFRQVTRSLLLSFAGLLAAVTLRFALETPWTWPGRLLALAALGLLLRKVDVHWVVLGGGLLSLWLAA
ncbi:MAG: chromate efflux transporter [Candidatus Delongbacteria bacterium]